MKTPIAILGATGPVGQKVISLLEDHPRLEVAELAASEARVGKRYGEVVSWKNELPLPERIARMELKPLLEVSSRCVISALPADVAREVEPRLAERGHFVSSNASAFRMESEVPLLVPEVNGPHLSLLEQQRTKGKLITNPNCSTVFLVSALAPLRELGAIEHVSVVTLQALSGAGYPGVSSFDLLGNVIPHIGGEEDKIQEETKRILGEPGQAADFGVTVHVHRVPVLHGHTIALHVRFRQETAVSHAREAYLRWQERFPELIAFHEEADRPQPARDLHPHEMRVHIGRLKQGDDPRTLGLISLGHNLVRGAAGAAIANLEAVLERTGEAR
jgi:aspartate-semialdehyde dehydrogenase